MIDHVSLQRCLTVDQGGHDVTVMDVLALFQNHDVAIQNVRPDHRIAPNSQREGAVIPGDIRRMRIQRDMAFDVLLRRGGHARRDLAINRHIGDSYFLSRRDQCARFAGVTLEKSFSFERGDVLHHRSLASKMKMTLDLARARGESFVALLALNEIEDAFLAMSQHKPSIGAAVRRCKFK